MSDDPYAILKEDVKQYCLEAVADAERVLRKLEALQQKREWPPVLARAIERTIEEARLRIRLHNDALSNVDGAIFPPVVVRFDPESLDAFARGLPIEIDRSFYRVEESFESESVLDDPDVDALPRRSHAAGLQRRLQKLIALVGHADLLQELADFSYSLGRYDERRLCRAFENDIEKGRGFLSRQANNGKKGDLTDEQQKILTERMAQLLRTTAKGNKSEAARLVHTELMLQQIPGINEAIDRPVDTLRRIDCPKTW